MTVEGRAVARRSRALDLLDALRLLERWGAVGTAELTGSVRHDLVVDRDIDIDVFVDELDTAAEFAVAGELAADPRVLRMLWRDDTERFGWHYWEIACLDAEGDEWRVELYVSPPEASFYGWTSELAGVLGGALSPAERHAVLALKEALAGDPEYRSMDVYRAVVDGGVRDLDAFHAWRSVNGSERLERWLPGTVPRA